jgi:glucosamine--fructose-6-phosphate aminotransferase (isomerizing)
VTARGYNFATALEAALKFKETSYIAAMPYSAADLMHGPIAMVEPGYPALLYSLSGRALAAMRQLERDLLERKAELVVVEDTQEGGDAGKRRGLRLPQATPEPLSPLVAIVPGQLLALHLAEARGYDPDRPRGLNKVTKTL